MKTYIVLMRACAGLLTAALCVVSQAGPSDGQLPAGATKILDNGPDTDRFVLVLLAEGFQNHELPDFAERADRFVDVFVTTPPFDRLCRAFNIYRIDVESDESGADRPASCDDTTMVATYFDATFCSDGSSHRLLGVNNATAIAVMDLLVPEWDEGLVIVNTPEWGGMGGSPGTTSIATGWEGIAIHEVGHSVFGLADEYEYRLGCNSGEDDRDSHPGPEPNRPNVTIQSNPSLVKWSHLVDPMVPANQPTTTNADCEVCDPQSNPFPGEMVVGVYEGAHYYHCDAYRPTFDCMMRNFADFCPVCVERIDDVIAPYLPPNQAPNCHNGGPYTVECQGGTTMVLLDASGSTDDGCLPLQYTWTGPFTGSPISVMTPTVLVEFTGLGIFNVTLTVSDGSLASACATTVAIVDTTPPELFAPPDLTVECESHLGTEVDLGTPIVIDTCDPNPTVSNDAPALFPLGITVVTWEAEDASGNKSQAVQVVTVEDTTPPILEVTLSPDNLWAPNHRWATITADIFVEDLCDDNPAVRLVSIESNEPVNATGDGNTEPDIRGAEFGTDDREFELRVERRGNRSGRVYTITYEAEDLSGNVTVTQAIVTVDHDRRR
jgi:hypothetical protein